MNKPYGWVDVFHRCKVSLEVFAKKIDLLFFAKSIRVQSGYCWNVCLVKFPIFRSILRRLLRWGVGALKRPSYFQCDHLYWYFCWGFPLTRNIRLKRFHELCRTTSLHFWSSFWKIANVSKRWDVHLVGHQVVGVSACVLPFVKSESKDVFATLTSFKKRYSFESIETLLKMENSW